MAAYIDATPSSDSITCMLAGLDMAYSHSGRTVTWIWGERGAPEYTELPDTIPPYAPVSPQKVLSGLQYRTEYMIRCQVYLPNTGSYVQFGPVYVTTGSPTERPPYFSWTYLKTSGGAFNLTAAEWNGLTANVNEVRAYKGLLPYDFLYVTTGESFTAEMYNQAVAAIRNIPGYSGSLAMVDRGDIVYAQQLNDLVTAINLIQ